MEHTPFLSGDLTPRGHEVVASVAFETPLPPARLAAILQLLPSLFTGPVTTLLPEIGLIGATELTITADLMKLRLCFAYPVEGDEESISHDRLHFVLYVFAQIHAVHTIAAHPFPPDFAWWGTNILSYYEL